MTIARRLYLLIFVSFLGLFITAGIGVYQMNKVYTITNYTNVNVVPSITELQQLNGYALETRSKMWQYFIADNAEKRDRVLQAMRSSEAKLQESLNRYEKNDLSDDKDAALLKEVRRTYGEFAALRSKAIAMMDDGRAASEAGDFVMANQATVDNFLNAMKAHNAYKTEIGQRASQNAEETLNSSYIFALVFTLIAVAGISFMGILIIRNIVASLTYAVEVAETVARGDLTSTISVQSDDEAGKVLHALRDMNNSLLNIVSQVRSSTDYITSASTEIATGNMDLSARTEQQAGSLEETASSMEELTSTVRQNADNARQANQLAVSASEVAVKGGSVVSDVVDTMNGINDSSKKIVDIISVIDGIAFQTNILALNAAVEAARAGEQGRGFAVVAAEVRNLAQRSASAAKEIKTLIDDSVEKTERGTRLVNEAGVTISEVVNSVRRVTDVVSEITAASQEQSAGIDQINLAITHMDEATQQNAALVEQAAAAAASMQDQANTLSQVVSVFKINQHQAATPAPRVTPAPAVTAARAATPAAQRALPHKTATVQKSAKTEKTASTRKAMPTSDAGGDWEEF
ncbi:methyl-accepting chemotaxis protein [Undibacterium oligocarboniphilum]|uniref:MCP four helix bundle domain-containing protein n=1 Tax=Undibacterium oligocarboniphilum TaxID=666702 RepID=A0A850QDN6_9BURK|nr:methyl-accepting chemotaxis protein [Undibacterium oligocarboniphilum]MBC3869312.1 MCP four helix bundle domain-containing protein [Undibacterium oligocarboniphilum]NVO77691.1 MCP four helix bundle domain-containing protein [Undibacterium oligocarboniphilum]